MDMPPPCGESCELASAWREREREALQAESPLAKVLGENNHAPRESVVWRSTPALWFLSLSLLSCRHNTPPGSFSPPGRACPTALASAPPPLAPLSD
eukprot:360874-Chlamydomonas_euryale.AAC.1